MTKRYVGIDLGGTNLKLGLVTGDGRIVERLSRPTEATRGPDFVMGQMVEAVRDLAKIAGVPLAEIAGIGVGAPGPLDTKAGVVIFAPNMPGWTQVPVVETLKRALSRPVRLENDANMAAYGEFRCGAGSTVRDMIMLTLGTGVGGGIVIDGRLFRGSRDVAGELGHIVIEKGGRRCGCRNHGCLEAYASATAVVGRFSEALSAGEASDLEKEEDFSCKDIFEAAGRGDRLAARIVAETADYLATGIASLLHVLNPAMVVLTGGMMNAGDEFLDRVLASVRAQAIGRAIDKCEIRWSTLGGDAGILGSALAAEAFDRTGQPA